MFIDFSLSIAFGVATSSSISMSSISGSLDQSKCFIESVNTSEAFFSFSFSAFLVMSRALDVGSFSGPYLPPGLTQEKIIRLWREKFQHISHLYNAYL